MIPQASMVVPLGAASLRLVWFGLVKESKLGEQPAVGER